jgi:hypothetical protein
MLSFGSLAFHACTVTDMMSAAPRGMQAAFMSESAVAVLMGRANVCFVP